MRRAVRYRLGYSQSTWDLNLKTRRELHVSQLYSHPVEKQIEIDNPEKKIEIDNPEDFNPEQIEIGTRTSISNRHVIDIIDKQ